MRKLTNLMRENNNDFTTFQSKLLNPLKFMKLQLASIYN